MERSVFATVKISNGRKCVVYETTIRDLMRMAHIGNDPALTPEQREDEYCIYLLRTLCTINGDYLTEEVANKLLSVSDVQDIFIVLASMLAPTPLIDGN
jgi:hypothetical protein